MWSFSSGLTKNSDGQNSNMSSLLLRRCSRWPSVILADWQTDEGQEQLWGIKVLQSCVSMTMTAEVKGAGGWSWVTWSWKFEWCRLTGNSLISIDRFLLVCQLATLELAIWLATFTIRQMQVKAAFTQGFESWSQEKSFLSSLGSFTLNLLKAYCAVNNVKTGSVKIEVWMLQGDAYNPCKGEQSSCLACHFCFCLRGNQLSKEEWRIFDSLAKMLSKLIKKADSLDPPRHSKSLFLGLKSQDSAKC